MTDMEGNDIYQKKERVDNLGDLILHKDWHPDSQTKDQPVIRNRLKRLMLFHFLEVFLEPFLRLAVVACALSIGLKISSTALDLTVLGLMLLLCRIVLCYIIESLPNILRGTTWISKNRSELRRHLESYTTNSMDADTNNSLNVISDNPQNGTSTHVKGTAIVDIPAIVNSLSLQSNIRMVDKNRIEMADGTESIGLSNLAKYHESGNISQDEGFRSPDELSEANDTSCVGDINNSNCDLNGRDTCTAPAFQSSQLCENGDIHNVNDLKRRMRRKFTRRRNLQCCDTVSYHTKDMHYDNEMRCCCYSQDHLADTTSSLQFQSSIDNLYSTQSTNSSISKNVRNHRTCGSCISNKKGAALYHGRMIWLHSCEIIQHIISICKTLCSYLTPRCFNISNLMCRSRCSF